VPSWAVRFADPHWRLTRRIDFWLTSTRVSISTSFHCFEICFYPEPSPQKLMLLRYFKSFQRNFLRRFLFHERYTEVLYMNNFYFDFIFLFERHIPQHCYVYVCVPQGQLALLNISNMGDKSADIGRLNDGSATSTGRVWEDGFLTSRREDKFSSCIGISERNCIIVVAWLWIAVKVPKLPRNCILYCLHRMIHNRTSSRRSYIQGRI
jgi:hypothetical protein